MILIHTSDLHLKNPQSEELDRIVKETIKRDAKALLIAGDLFDSNNPSKETISYVKKKFKKLKDKKIFVFVIMGDSEEKALRFKSLGRNVKIFRSKKIKIKKIKGLKVYGASYSKGNPLKKFISNNTSYSIGMLHVRLEDLKVEEINNSNLDYLALGHYHDLTKVKSKIPCYYSGSPVKKLKYKISQRYIMQIDLDKKKIKKIKI